MSCSSYLDGFRDGRSVALHQLFCGVLLPEYFLLSYFQKFLFEEEKLTSLTINFGLFWIDRNLCPVRCAFKKQRTEITRVVFPREGILTHPPKRV